MASYVASKSSSLANHEYLPPECSSPSLIPVSQLSFDLVKQLYFLFKDDKPRGSPALSRPKIVSKKKNHTDSTEVFTRTIISKQGTACTNANARQTRLSFQNGIVANVGLRNTTGTLKLRDVYPGSELSEDGKFSETKEPLLEPYFQDQSSVSLECEDEFAYALEKEQLAEFSFQSIAETQGISCFSEEELRKINHIIRKANKFLFLNYNLKKIQKKFSDTPLTELKKIASKKLATRIISYEQRKKQEIDDTCKKIAFLKEGEKVFIVGYQKILGIGSFNTAILVKDFCHKKLRVYRLLKDMSNEGVKLEAKYEAYIHSIIQSNPKMASDVVGLKAVIEKPNSFGLMLEYCGGGNLREKYMRFSPSQKKTIAIEIFRALKRLHVNFVHADLKMDNILLQDGNHPKLADFGKSFILSDPLYRGGDFRYMPPESFFKNTSKTEKIDSWAMGMLLYEMKYYRTPSISILLCQLGVIQNANHYENMQAIGLHFEEMIKLALLKIAQTLDPEDAYDNLVLELLQYDQSARLSCQQAYVIIQDIPDESFSLNKKSLKRMGYFTTMSLNDAINRMQYNINTNKNFPQCTLLKDKQGQMVFVFTKVLDSTTKVSYSNCNIKSSKGKLYLEFENRTVSIGEVISRYHRLV